MRYAVVKNEKIENIVLWNGDNDWQPPEGSELIKLENDEKYSVGGTLKDGEYTPPERKEEGEETDNE